VLTRIIDLSLRHRAVVLALAAVLAVAGAFAFRALDMDAFPDTTPVQVQVNVVAETLGPVEVERRLTIPLEQALAGLPRLAELRSLSKFGFAQVVLQFEDGTDLWFARQQVAERIARVHLPAGVDPPTLGPVANGLG
jgi:heavy metal efflux system protein